VVETTSFRGIKTLRNAAIYSSFWLVVALNMAVRSVASHKLIGDNTAYPHALALALALCALWASLVPLIFRLARRYPITVKTWRFNMLTHAGFALTFVCISVAFRFLLDLPFPSFRRVHGTSFTVLGIYALTGLGRSLLIYGLALAVAHAWSRYRALQAPNEEEGSVQRLEDASSAMGQTADRFAVRFEFKLNGRMYFVQAADIEWIEAAGNYVSLHVGEKSYLLRETMHGIEGRLDPEVFVRVHRSAIVQVTRVREIQNLPSGRYHALLKSGARIPLGSNGIERLGRMIPRVTEF
jgi:DNA-binding LytR/AlgR family response regulator